MVQRSRGTGWPSVAARRKRAGHVRHHARDLRRLPRHVLDRCAAVLRLHKWLVQSETGHVTVDLNEYERNVASVRSWCATNPRETVVAGLQRATGTSGR